MRPLALAVNPPDGQPPLAARMAQRAAGTKRRRLVEVG